MKPVYQLVSVLKVMGMVLALIRLFPDVPGIVQASDQPATVAASEDPGIIA